MIRDVGSQIFVGVVVGITLASLLGVWRWAVKPVVRGVNDIKSLLITDEHGMGVIDRLDSIDALIAKRTPIFDETRAQVSELAGQMAVVISRTEQLIPNGGMSMSDKLTRIDANTTASPST